MITWRTTLSTVVTPALWLAEDPRDCTWRHIVCCFLSAAQRTPQTQANLPSRDKGSRNCFFHAFSSTLRVLRKSKVTRGTPPPSVSKQMRENSQVIVSQYQLWQFRAVSPVEWVKWEFLKDFNFFHRPLNDRESASVEVIRNTSLVSNSSWNFESFTGSEDGVVKILESICRISAKLCFLCWKIPEKVASEYFPRFSGRARHVPVEFLIPVNLPRERSRLQ